LTAPALRPEQRERRFALTLFGPAFLLLLLITTAPLVYLVWTSLQRLDMGMPWLSGFAGLGNYAKMGGDPRFWNSLVLTLVYTGSTVVLQVIVGLSLALLVLQIPRGQGLLRLAAILPIVLAPVVVGLFWRTLVLAPDVGLVDLVTRSLGLGSHNWLGDPQLALISVIANRLDLEVGLSVALFPMVIMAMTCLAASFRSSCFMELSSFCNSASSLLFMFEKYPPPVAAPPALVDIVG
jgi:ABC-type sugar transport system permease subunit